MAMKSLSELRALFKEPQLLHKWTVEVPTWPSAAQPSNPNVLFMMTSAGMPEMEYENVTVDLGTFKMTHNANENRNGKLPCTFFENTDSDIIKYFFIDYANKRKNSASDSSVTPEASNSSELIAPIVLMNLMAADGKTLTKQAKLLNVLFEPTSFGGELGQEVMVQKPTVNFVYDHFVWTKA